MAGRRGEEEVKRRRRRRRVDYGLDRMGIVGNRRTEQDMKRIKKVG
jgi:hypothetical protein